MDWEQHAKCKGMPLFIFFDKVQEKRAKLICSKCLVNKECLQAGQYQQGIWGGTSEEERVSLRTKQWVNKTYSSQQNTSHEQLHPECESQIFPVRILNWQIHNQQVCNYLVDEQPSFRLVLHVSLRNRLLEQLAV